MKTRCVWLGVLVAAGGGIAGCSGRVDPENDCIEEFVQEVVIEEPHTMANRSPVCFGQQVSGPPDYPNVRRIIRIEYSDGDFHTTQVYKDWDWHQNRDDPRCDLVEPSETVFQMTSIGGQTQYAGTADGKALGARDLNRSYGSAFPFGVKPETAPIRGKGAVGAIETTEFQIDCAWEERRFLESERMSEECLPVAPIPNCPAFDMMLPIHLKGFFGRDPIHGKTTTFKVGKKGSLVDKSRWKTPP